MKTKNYTFTADEIMTLRNALLFYYHDIKDLKPTSPLYKKNLKNAKALKEQFMQDYSLI